MDILCDYNEHRRTIMAWLVFVVAFAALASVARLAADKQIECHHCPLTKTRDVSIADHELCGDDTCKGYHCFKEVNTLPGWKVVTKGCIPWNRPPENAAGCTSSKKPDAADAVDTVCYCDDKDLCNAAAPARTCRLCTALLPCVFTIVPLLW